ncbi:unnamed protein product [Rotaria socialis]|uniref:G-protein coupled receptors family 1 profile domain-containing protein n=1 Tax=Rotaria socialis TaxID=392032 RepID=A0A818CWK5_9BILA|nr:unnamed protein product [Rotaria socialis]CAF3434460.1 unnamed protein product [Rotaria socialis]CAF4102112.1 unnamed protein product [Rotaria socialis]CAF4507277.1 unnamed protein product [Rotaria socialis]
MSIVYRVIPLVLFLFVYIVGLIGNGLLIFIVFRQKNLRTVPNLLVVSLAMGDFLFVLFCVPFGAVAYSLEYYPFSTFYCRFENFIINLSLGVSVFSLLALSADRYKIIVKPFSSHASDPANKLKTIVISIWFLSVLLALPETIYSGIITDTITEANNKTINLVYCWSPNESELLSNHRFMISRQILRLITYYIMPLIFVSIFYILIAKRLFQAKSAILTPMSTQSFVNEISNAKRGQINSKPTKTISSSTLSNKSNLQEQRRQNEIISSNYKKNLSKHSITLDNDELLNLRESSSSSSRTASLRNSTQRNREPIFNSPTINNNNNNNNNIALHTLYRHAKVKKQLRARHKVAKTVLFLCSVFFICWLPKQIHDLYWFIGVLVYSAPWNHYWQFNKTLALIFSYTYSCINPFALYFLSTTFRHFYKRYLFFWTNTPCCSKGHLANHMQQHRTGDNVTFIEYQRNSSANNVANIYCDLNRMKNSSSFQQKQNLMRMNQYLSSDVPSTENGPQINGASYPSVTINPC